MPHHPGPIPENDASDVLHNLIWHTGPDAIEALQALYLVIFGSFLLLPVDTFSATPTFDTMKAITVFTLDPELFWGLLISGVGVNALLVRFLVRRFEWRAWAAVLCTLMLVVMGIAFVAANPASPTTAIYPLLACSQFWVWARIYMKAEGVQHG